VPFLRQNRRIWWIGGSIVAVALVALVVRVRMESSVQFLRQTNTATPIGDILHSATKAPPPGQSSSEETPALPSEASVAVTAAAEQPAPTQAAAVPPPSHEGPPALVSPAPAPTAPHKAPERNVIRNTHREAVVRREREELSAREQSPSPETLATSARQAELAARAARKELSERKETLEALPKGNITLRAPTAMKVSDKRKVEAEVGVKVPKTAERPSPPGNSTVEGTLHLSSEMFATLEGPGFEIKAITPEQQPIAEGFPTVWSWNVEAKESGEQELQATLYAIVGEKAARMRIASFTQKISVSVREQTWGEWLDSLGHEIGTLQGIFVAFGAVATPALAWLGIRRRGKLTAEAS
jgi:hypothetical protein